MKKTIVSLSILLFFLLGFAACSEWTETEANDYTKPWQDYTRPASYYKALREYKKSDHSVAFGWYGNWTGTGATQVNCLMGLPDSVDFVSMWGNWHSLSPEKMADKQRVKELKGTRVMMCFIIANIGDQLTPESIYVNEDGTPITDNGIRESKLKEYWGWNDGDEASIDAAIRKYADRIMDTMIKYDFDGFDYDLEPHYGSAGNIASYKDRLGIFVDQMSKYCGPKSGTDRLLCVDGEPYEIPAEYSDCLDYFIIQAYASGSYVDLDGRLQRLITAFDGVMTAEEVTRRTIMCENFESYALNGGVSHTTRDGKTVRSLLGMALWEPTTGARKGGVGSYHMEYEYSLTPEYRYLRTAIGIMNPSLINDKK